MKEISEVKALYGASEVTVLAGTARGFIPGEMGINLVAGEKITLEDQVLLIKTPRLPNGMKAISIKDSKLMLPLGTLLKRNSERKLHPDTEALLAASKAKDADTFIKYLAGKALVVSEVEPDCKVQKFVDGQPVENETVTSRRYGFKLFKASTTAPAETPAT